MEATLLGGVLGVGDVTEPCGVVVAAGGQDVPLGAERHRVDSAVVAGDPGGVGSGEGAEQAAAGFGGVSEAVGGQAELGGQRRVGGSQTCYLIGDFLGERDV